ncbi:MAG: ferric reductase-like transmembrane domain-containing protein [Neomegalonema sp.]|nr:ferric reductase-like transmembrane domain-containing protein [Neomegalonema sp.]
MLNLRAILVWAALAIAIVAPIVIAAMSPQLAWRRPAYIVAGFAGVIAMALLLLQPLLARGYLPGVQARLGRRLHGWIGGGLVAAVLAHVVGLWLTSPPDVVDALLFRSPTPFSAWGTIAMWAVFLSAIIAASRRALRLRIGLWRFVHMSLALLIIIGGVIHALLIEGTMEPISKAALCALVIVAALKAAYDLRPRSKGKNASP